ncbi:MAG: rod shape-determining protein RodA [Phycisphaerales bacterium]|jgi:rod shape determining protein RodA|nr:rod shape-determining protein RodA [Phycisphaerales bacterium]MBT7170269.1 rod shape-determining protein RodA [Phycisphaerales bacterium]
MRIGKIEIGWAVVLIFFAMIALIAVGFFSIRAAESVDSVRRGFAQKQLVFAALSVVVFLVIAAVPYIRIGKLAYPLFGLTLVLLVGVFWTRPIRGAYRWFDLGFMKFQASELAKLSYIILLAWYLRTGSHYRTLRGLAVPFGLTFVPLVLILREPDLGTSLLLPPTLMLMLFMAGARKTHLLGVVLVGAILLLLPVPQSASSMGTQTRTLRTNLAYWTSGEGESKTIVTAAALAVMKPHQLERIDGFLRQDDPDVIQGNGYHLHYAKMVLGSGKLHGRDDWEPGQTFFRLLPDDHTDFVYSVIGGNFGFAGCLLVLILYGAIFVAGAEIAAETVEPFGRLLAIGVMGLMLTQLTINVGMTMGIMPITGMTLPFISYGGSSLLINCAALGLLVSIGLRRPVFRFNRPFEHTDNSEPMPYTPLDQRGGAQ